MPGAGTGVAAGLGVTSMLTDLAADMIDPAVTKGEVLTNLGMNAGFFTESHNMAQFFIIAQT